MSTVAVNLLLDTTPLGASLWNRDARMFLCNDELVKLFNTGTKEECCKRFFDFTPKYQPDGELSSTKAKRYIKEAFETGTCKFNWLHALPDGTPMPGEVTFVRVEYEDDYAVAAYFRDMSEHTAIMKDIERRDHLLEITNTVSGILLQSDAKHFLKDLHACMGMFAKALDIDHISIWKNIAMEDELYYYRVFEWTNEAETPGVAIYEPESMYSNENLKCYSTHVPGLYSDLKNGNCTNNLVRDLPDIDRNNLSEQGILSLFVAPIFIQEKFWGIVSYRNYHDERLFTESEQTIMHSGSLVIANALSQNEMKLHLMSSAEKLEEARDEAERANNAKSDFLARVSHEIRTPLNAVLGLTLLLLEKDGLDNETYSSLDNIYNSGATILDLVNDVLDIAKIESGVLNLENFKYDTLSMLNDAITQNILRIGDKSIEFKLSIDSNMFLYLTGDELRVKQIINNLLSNAIKYTDSGEIELITNSMRDENAVWLTIKVRDTGKGIKEEDISKLYDDYLRLGDQANRSVEGIGLGLSITKRLCELMQGTITVESKFGEGSTFTVKLKQSFVSDEIIDLDIIKNLNVIQYSRSNNYREFRRNIEKLPYARVLIVDDNLTNLEVARGLFMPYGMNIDCVTSGEKAIEAISSSQKKYDAIFLDQMMPGMDGVETAKRIRNLGSDYAKNITIIAFTANAVYGNEEMFLRQGFQGFLTKPIDISKLDEIIDKWLRNKEKDAKLLTNLKVDGLDIQEGVKRFGRDDNTYLNILNTYAVDTRSLLKKIDPINENDIENYEIIVHGIKSSSKDICAEELGTLAEKLEKAAQINDINYLKENNAYFVKKAWKLISELDVLLDTVDNDNPKIMMEKLDSKMLDELRKACESFDIDKVDAIMAKINVYQYINDNSLHEWLKEKSEMMKFKEISGKLSYLKRR